MMLRYARRPKARSYAVEVSGWDLRHNFFVENCELLWTDDRAKQIGLSRKLNDNAIVLVRLRDASDSERGHAVVYRAEWLGKAENGMNQFCLRALEPSACDPERSRLENGDEGKDGKWDAEYRAFLTETKN
jgi:hypothetical protein